MLFLSMLINGSMTLFKLPKKGGKYMEEEPKI